MFNNLFSTYYFDNLCYPSTNTESYHNKPLDTLVEATKKNLNSTCMYLYLFFYPPK